MNRIITINKYLSKSLFVLPMLMPMLMLAGTASVSANMLVSTKNDVDSNLLGFQRYQEFKGLGSAESSMYLGQWRDQISSKLNPSYFNRLVNKRFTRSVSNNYLDINFLPNFAGGNNRFIAPVFSDYAFSILGAGEVYFSFASNNIKFEPSVLESSWTNFNTGFGSKFSKPILLEQEYYTPGYVISNGNSSFGVAAILVQQSFLDDSLGSLVVASSSSNFIYFDETQGRTNRGTGYQFNFTQKLFNDINISVDYQSQINMNEFDVYGRSYSEQGEFDTPGQYTFSLDVPIFTNNVSTNNVATNSVSANKLSFSAERISYSNIDSRVHSGFSQAFLNVYNGIFSPVYALQDLTVYSIGFEQNINNGFSWNIEITSRQQAPATVEIYDRILTEDTASVSYKLGIAHSAPIGQFNLYASFANKPLFIGATDFGRFNSSMTRHIEGVASWSFQF
ncbi:MAG: hypothetical protein L3J83_05860 [Proteobacteria bacterium]|nr:hypothetical protein [Pseudomonadota bacterium]